MKKTVFATKKENFVFITEKKPKLMEDGSVLLELTPDDLVMEIKNREQQSK